MSPAKRIRPSAFLPGISVSLSTALKVQSTLPHHTTTPLPPDSIRKQGRVHEEMGVYSCWIFVEGLKINLRYKSANICATKFCICLLSANYYHNNTRKSMAGNLESSISFQKRMARIGNRIFPLPERIARIVKRMSFPA